jgi:2-dehydropantoate 2-reductase
MRICIVGAGAVGGFLGTRLARAGATVGALARGATRDALATHGWRLDQDGMRLTGPVAAVSDDPAALGPQDLVILAVKEPALRALAPRLGPLLGPDTVVMTAMNGVPWWFLRHGIDENAGGDRTALRLESVDPAGVLSAAIDDARVVGCVVHCACATDGPGLVRHTVGRRFIVGEPDGRDSARVRTIAALMTEAGFDAPVSTRIRAEVWYKLWGNMTTNPISALTGATADRIIDDPLVARFSLAVMAEAAAIGTRIGCPIAERGEERMAVTRKLGAFRTSMLQDVDAGRPLEIDAMLTVVCEIAQGLGIAVPWTEALLGLARLKGRVAGLYPEA